MERPTYKEAITFQNDAYAIDVVERFSGRPKTASTVLAAIAEAFILGAGGYEGSFDAAIVLECGGMAVLLESLGLPDIDRNMSTEVDTETFEAVVRASVDYGMSWDDLEAEIPSDAVADTDITGDHPLAGPLVSRFRLPLDGGQAPPWRVD